MGYESARTIDGAWYNLVRAFGAFYSTEPNQGLLVRIESDGTLTPIVTQLVFQRQ